MSSPTRWGIYLRISRTDDRLGVERQLEDCRLQLATMGEDPDAAELFDENNTSATKGLDKRPEYLRLMSEIKAGRIGGVIVFLQDRAWRDTDELSAFLKLGVRFATSSTGEANLDDPDTLAAIKIAGVNAEREVKVAGRRIAKASGQRARAGKAHGRAPFGWRREVAISRGRVVDSWDVIDEAEAGFLRHAADQLLRGISLRSVAVEANAGDVKPRPYSFTKGRYAGRDAAQRWSTAQIKALLLRASNAGLRTHRGEVLEDVVAEWPAIFDLATYERIKLVLADPDRRTNDRGSAPQWLLSGLVVCSVCPDGGRINVQTGGARGRRPAYACVGQPGKRGCLQRHWVDDVDEYVGELVEGRLADPTLGVAGPEAQLEIDDLYRRIDAQRAEQVEAGKLLGQRILTISQVAELNVAVETEIAALEAKISELRPTLVASFLPDGWAKADILTRRAAVKQIFERLEFIPSTVHGKSRTYKDVEAELAFTFRGALGR